MMRFAIFLVVLFGCETKSNIDYRICMGAAQAYCDKERDEMLEKINQLVDACSDEVQYIDHLYNASDSRYTFAVDGKNELCFDFSGEPRLFLGDCSTPYDGNDKGLLAIMEVMRRTDRIIIPQQATSGEIITKYLQQKDSCYCGWDIVVCNEARTECWGAE